MDIDNNRAQLEEKIYQIFLSIFKNRNKMWSATIINYGHKNYRQIRSHPNKTKSIFQTKFHRRWGSPSSYWCSCRYLLRLCSSFACDPTNTSSLEVYIVPHSHDDVGWLKTVDDYYTTTVHYILDTVFSALYENPGGSSTTLQMT